MKDWAACPALAASRKARPAPVSKRFILKLRFLLDLLTFRLATIISPCGAAIEGARIHLGELPI
jgi:hypothetical protein